MPILKRLRDKLNKKSKKELRLIFLKDDEIKILSDIGKITFKNGVEVLF